ncbi:MAG: SpoVA/SpoVAEb family sporulation membrane protein [Clostridiales bacterium]|nr:SpoVA/SpoVAEb family sporulation membrane protein [Clostridiales bacterium]
MYYLWVFLIGGFICMLGQMLIIYTNITSARILVTFVLIGVILQAFGIFDPISQFAKAGINVPIIGFGASLAKGAIGAVQAKGVIGAFTGGLEATAGGIAAAVVFAFIFALIFKSKTKS